MNMKSSPVPMPRHLAFPTRSTIPSPHLFRSSFPFLAAVKGLALRASTGIGIVIPPLVVSIPASGGAEVTIAHILRNLRPMFGE